MAALADYASEQDAHIVFLPRRLPASDELNNRPVDREQGDDRPRAIRDLGAIRSTAAAG